MKYKFFPSFSYFQHFVIYGFLLVTENLSFCANLRHDLRQNRGPLFFILDGHLTLRKKESGILVLQISWKFSLGETEATLGLFDPFHNHPNFWLRKGPYKLSSLIFFWLIKKLFKILINSLKTLVCDTLELFHVQILPKFGSSRYFLIKSVPTCFITNWFFTSCKKSEKSDKSAQFLGKFHWRTGGHHSIDHSS